MGTKHKTEITAEDGVIAKKVSGTANAVAVFTNADAQPSGGIRADGLLFWGPGGSTSVDTFLYRNGAGKLNIDGEMRANVPLGKVVTLTDAATIDTDASAGSHFRVTLGGNRTLGAPTNPTNGQKIIYEVIQDGTGSRTLAYNSVFAFSTDIPTPTLTLTASKRDFLGFVYNSTAAKWYCLAVVKGF